MVAASNSILLPIVMREHRNQKRKKFPVSYLKKFPRRFGSLTLTNFTRVLLVKFERVILRTHFF